MSQWKEVSSLDEVIRDLDERSIHGRLRYRLMNGYISMKARHDDIPVSGTFELTPFCNFDCKMCYVHLNPVQLGEKERLLTIDEWKHIINQAVNAGMLFGDLTGGECLTYHGFREIYLHLCSLGIRPSILTNGWLLTEEMVSFLSQYPPTVIQITLYGSCEEAYERVCGQRAFQGVLDGIERVKKANLNLMITVSPSKYMQDDFPALLKLIHSLNVPYQIGSVTLSARPETERNMEEYTVESELLIAMLKEENQLLHREKEDEADNIVMYTPPIDKKLVGLPCGGGHSSFHVNWKGELCPCIAFSSSVHYSIFENGFTGAWNSVREKMSLYKPPKECNSCEFSKDCLTCPGEKTMGIVNGAINRIVCQKKQLSIDVGLD